MDEKLINSGVLMESFQNLLVVLLCFSVDQTNSQGLPDCNLFGLPCNISSMPSMGTHQPYCSCPGNVSCYDPDRALTFETLELTSPEETIITTLSYCSRLSIPERTCNSNTETVAEMYTWWPGSIIVRNITCQCSKPLVLVKEVKTMSFSDTYFTCGKPICDVCESEPPACAIKTITDEHNTQPNVTELPCKCPYGYSCDIDSSKLPLIEEALEFFCKPTGNTTDLA